MNSGTIPELLRARLAVSVEALGADPKLVHVHAASDTRFGDYQTNIAMLLAKVLRKSPRQIAGEIIEADDCADICENVEIAGAGFINFRLSGDFVATRLAVLAADERLGTPVVERKRKIIIDFSAPNVAKPMHVGHIRSTILGDALSRIARFLGHDVVTDNHIGDWGTQFGKVIYGWKHFLDKDALDRNPVGELVRLYRMVNKLSEEDPAVLDACRTELVQLQQGDEDNLAIWKQAVELSKHEFASIYERLGIEFDEVLGESHYNERLAPLCDRLKAEGIAEISEGALCIFFPENEELSDKPCLIRKSDGGFLYATTDLATLEFRVETWNPDAIWYVTGAPQQLHFKQIFEAAMRMQVKCDLRHIAFGSILGEDRKLMKTRSGENVQLGDVLDEALDRAAAAIRDKNPEMNDAEVTGLAEIIGIGAVKYTELSQHRMSDYVFSWDRMLSLQGNTAPYLQNAYVRIQSIFRKYGATPPGMDRELAGLLTHDAEIALARKLFQFGESVHIILDEFRPNLLATYLFELANTFHSFYEACTVLKAESKLQEARLALCAATASVLGKGLDLLGVQVPDKM